MSTDRQQQLVRSNTGAGHQTPAERSMLALDALSKLTKQFANKPDFQNLIRTILFTLSGQFSVASSFALLLKPGTPDREATFIATGKFNTDTLLQSIILTPEISRHFRKRPSPCQVSELNLPDDCSGFGAIFRDCGIELVCPLVHNDKLLGIIGLGRRVLGKPLTVEDVELIDVLIASILPLIVSSYHFYEMTSLSAWHIDILNGVKQGVFVFDVENRLLKVNTAGLCILRKFDSQLGDIITLQGMLIEEVFPEIKFKGWAQKFLKANIEGRGKPIDNLIVTSNNAKYVYEAYLIGISGGSEFQTDFIVTLDDVTERKRAEEALHEERELLEATLESTADGILTVDGSGRVTHANARFMEMWRIPSELFELRDDQKLLSYVLDQLVDPEAFLTKVRELYQSTAKSFDTLHFKDGRVLERHSCPLIRGQEIDGRVWNFRDVTERVQAEKQKRELRERLERAERMESLGILAGGVAHDLNNILGPLVGYPELMLLKLPDDSQLRKQVQRIGNSAREAANVVQDLLTLARRGRYDTVPTDLNEIVEAYIDSTGFIKLKEANPNVSVKTEYDRQIGKILGSSSHLSKVAMNLVVNAFDAMPNGGELTMTTSRLHLEKLLCGYEGIVPGDYVLLRVKDTGVGIDPKDVRKIFEPYYSKKQMGTSGSGLGLSVVYGVVKDHKGYYDILSAVGEGTEFILYFPVTKMEIEDAAESEASYGGNEKVLIVDDVADQREIASDLLLSLGYRVETACNGRDAVKYVENQTVDIVLLDMIMEKDFDGLQTYKEMIKQRPGQKAIIVSGFSATERVQEMQRLGAGQYVKKPYSRETIGRAVRKELDKEPL